MGSIISDDHSAQDPTNQTQKNILITKNWEVLENTLHKEILRSKKTSLVVERYWLEIQNQQDFEAQNKIYDWRNTNPNAEFMVNILSVGRDEQQQTTVSCGTMQWCPSQKEASKMYVVTERILNLGEFESLLRFQKKIEMENQPGRILYATQRYQSRICGQSKKDELKLLPFSTIKFDEFLACSILKDWLRGIEVLCYKFGYFRLCPQLLGMTVRKRGTVWISYNYAVNHLSQLNRIEVVSAERKFRFQKQTINKIVSFTQHLPGFNKIIQYCKKSERFQQLSQLLDKHKNILHPHVNFTHNPKPHHGKNNTSLCVEHGSFLGHSEGFFLFGQNVQERVASKKRIKQTEKLAVVDNSPRRLSKITNTSSIRSSLKKSIKRSNTGQKKVLNLSPKNNQIKFINSNHQICGKQTVPTNQNEHSSSLESVNQPYKKISSQGINLKRNQDKNLMIKSQNNTKLRPTSDNQSQQKNPFANLTKKIFPNNFKHSFSSQPYIFRSQANLPHDLNFNTPRSPVSPVIPEQKQHKQNYSLDEANIVGPYKKDRIYSNLRKQKIQLIDSMVMVRQQSDDFDQDVQNGSTLKYVLEESIIIKGSRECEPILG